MLTASKVHVIGKNILVTLQIKISGLFLFLFFLVAIGSVVPVLSLPLKNTAFWTLVELLMIGTILKLKYGFFNKYDNDRIIWVKLFVFIALCNFLRGVFIAENYWEWKNLVYSTLTMFLPLSVYIGNSPELVSRIIKFWVRYCLPFIVVLIPFFIFNDGYGKFMLPAVLFFIFFYALPYKWKVFSLIIFAFIVVSGLDARSNILKTGIALLIGFVPFFSIGKINIFYRIIHFVLILTPLVFFLLGVFGDFNVFRISEYIDPDNTKYAMQFQVNGNLTQTSLVSDTRTFIYEESLSSAINNDYWLFGRTAAQGYDSNVFGIHLGEELGTGKYQRFSSEVSLLNVFTWFGLLGVVFYFIIFLTSSYLAIYRSKSIFLKSLGIFIAFRWLYSWIEDFSTFDLNYLILWILVGICYSSKFRNFSNNDFKEWIYKAFSKKLDPIFKVN